MNTESTPFDELIRKIWQLRLSPDPAIKLNSNTDLILSCITELRVVYLHMLQWSNTQKEIRKANSIRDIVYHYDDQVTLKHLYFNYLDLLNRFGRLFLSHKIEIPMFYEIRFFRNKVVEHFDDYIQVRQNGPSGYVRSPNKIPIPHILGTICEPAKSSKDLLDLTTAINTYSDVKVCVGDIEKKWYQEYSDKIFPILRQIDYKLRKQETTRKTILKCGSFSLTKKVKRSGIPEEIVNKLYIYNFPMPINDIELYTSNLATFLREKLSNVI